MDAIGSSALREVQSENRQVAESYNMVNYRTRGSYSVDSHVQYRDYSVEGNYRYFVSNGCTNYGIFSVEVVEILNGASEEDIPAYVEHLGGIVKLCRSPRTPRIR